LTTSKGKVQPKYRLHFMPEALEEWHQLDGSIRVNLKKTLAKRLDRPHVPGGALHGALAGCYKIKLLKQGVRLVYCVEDDPLIVLVLAVDKREDNVAYTSATARLSASAAQSLEEQAGEVVAPPRRGHCMEHALGTSGQGNMGISVVHPRRCHEVLARCRRVGRLHAAGSIRRVTLRWWRVER
jgi:mRNA interferase RelE/StbE